jgi:superfamily II DNA or RNA helicase
MARLRFVGGTIELTELQTRPPELGTGCVWDERTACLRAPGMAYAEIVRALTRAQIPFSDEAKSYQTLEHGLRARPEPRPFQSEALAAWRSAQGRGVVVLPTGAGKSHLALLAIADRKRSTLVVAPTLDLVRQWYDLMRTSFGTEVGIVGGGEYSLHALTVTTYDSAYLHMEHLGARFGLVVFDECHHLPGATYSLAAELCLAPYRLGLTATPERTDGREARLDELIGPVVYRKDILELSGRYLAEYDTERILVALTPEERAEYESERAIYLTFLRQNSIVLRSPTSFQEFIRISARSNAGRRAMQAYRRQRELAFAAPGKLEYVAHLLQQHRRDRVLVFSEDNASAYAVSRRFLIPAITHQTKVRERSEILVRFAEGRYGAVVTSRVLNEGVDVPDANVAIIISGSGSVREHVQRLGRILRKKEGKCALLYELVSEGTSETRTSERRREHEAYRS